MSLLFGASVYTFSLILAVFLAGLGIGGFVGSRLARRADAPPRRLGMIQAMLALARSRFGAWAIVNVLPHWQPTALFLPNVRATPSLTFAYRRAPLRVRAAAGHDPVGRQLPADAGRAAARADFGRHVARINAINTTGALAGAIAFTLIGIPMLGSHNAQQVLVIVRGDQRPICSWRFPNALACRDSARSPSSRRWRCGSCRRCRGS